MIATTEDYASRVVQTDLKIQRLTRLIQEMTWYSSEHNDHRMNSLESSIWIILRADVCMNKAKAEDLRRFQFDQTTAELVERAKALEDLDAGAKMEQAAQLPAPATARAV